MNDQPMFAVHAIPAARSARKAINHNRRKADRPALDDAEWNILQELAQQAQTAGGWLPDVTTLDPAQLGVLGELAGTLCIRASERHEDAYIWPRLTPSAIDRVTNEAT